ncbi:MAG: UDP-N-acetylmuramate:L-alanyl-gamma-D-glutamyl-meso-diaminopimelate ligase, partial [Proteobacteria bacterium]|nr:UDP-N-acetylmuramate:L-alanyl-gamma-D-glutamyl-meso-diaminopimelate ligase [Pseudomonadota bacterium]
TLETLRKTYPEQRLIAILELRSNTMQMGVHRKTLVPALKQADIACVVSNAEKGWALPEHQHPALNQFSGADDCLAYIRPLLRSNDVVIIMSNGNFDGLVNTLRDA